MDLDNETQSKLFQTELLKQEFSKISETGKALSVSYSWTAVLVIHNRTAEDFDGNLSHILCVRKKNLKSMF